MTQNNPQVPWTDEQWARVNQIIQEEAQRARVVATFLPLYGPLPADADFVRAGEISGTAPLTIDDTDTIQLSTLQLNVKVRDAQMADPEMASALALFRRAANVLARLEDALIFNGQPGPNTPPTFGAPNAGEKIYGGEKWDGLLKSGHHIQPPVSDGNTLVTRITDAIGYLEGNGHFGPFAVVLSQDLFSIAQTPVNILTNAGPSSVPQDRILPLLGGGSLLRSSAFPDGNGVVVALGGAPVELVVATDMSLEFLQVTEDARFAFRVFEKVVLRIKEQKAIAALSYRPLPPSAPAAGTPTGPSPAASRSGGPPKTK